jgi:hypothetical protein
MIGAIVPAGGAEDVSDVAINFFIIHLLNSSRGEI